MCRMMIGVCVAADWRTIVALSARGRDDDGTHLARVPRQEDRRSRRLPGAAGPVPVDPDFPVLSAGPTPHTPLDAVDVHDRRARSTSRKPWTLGGVPRAARARRSRVDIHCVTKWSKLDTTWEGVSVDTLLEGVEHDADVRRSRSATAATRRTCRSRTSRDGKAWVAYAYDGEPLEPEHGGPARLLVPHLYFWKSAKWVRGLRLMDRRRARLLGDLRLPQLRRPVARAAVLRATELDGSATVVERRSTRRRASRRIVLDVPGLARPPRRASTSTSG